MKIKNIVQIVTLMGLVATGSAQSMPAILSKGAKAAMRWTGNAIGVGLPLSASVLHASQSIKRKNIVEKEPDNFRNPTTLEQEFLDKYITSKDTTVKIHKIDAIHQSSACFTDGKHIITIPENYSFIYDGNTTPTSLEGAIKTNNQEVLSRCAAILQHKNAHKSQHYYDKVSALGIALPIVTTGAVAGYMRSLMPYKKTASLTRHAVGMCGKSLGGVALSLGNGLIHRKIHHNLEYNADEKISHEYKRHYAQDLQKHNVMLDKQIEAGALIFGMQPDQKLTEQWTEKVAEKIICPPVSERIDRLKQPEPKNFLERIQQQYKRI